MSISGYFQRLVTVMVMLTVMLMVMMLMMLMMMGFIYTPRLVSVEVRRPSRSGKEKIIVMFHVSRFMFQVWFGYLTMKSNATSNYYTDFYTLYVYNLIYNIYYKHVSQVGR